MAVAQYVCFVKFCMLMICRMSFGTFCSFSIQYFRSLRVHEPFVCCICRILFNFSIICVMLTAPGGGCFDLNDGDLLFECTQNEVL